MQKQRDNIASFCLQNRLFLTKVFEDNGASGTDFHRKGWSELKKFLSDVNGSITYLVVDEPSRVGRNYSNVEKEMSRLKEDFDITVVTVREVLGLHTRLKKEFSNKKRGRTLILCAVAKPSFQEGRSEKRAVFGIFTLQNTII